MIFFVLIIKIFDDVSVLIHHDLFIIHHLLAIFLLVLMTAASSCQLMLIHQVLLELSSLVFVHIVHVDELFIIVFIPITIIFIIIFHVDL